MVDGVNGKNVMGMMVLGVEDSFTLKLQLPYRWTFWAGPHFQDLAFVQLFSGFGIWNFYSLDLCS